MKLLYGKLNVAIRRRIINTNTTFQMNRIFGRQRGMNGGEKHFETTKTTHGRMGFLIGTELWFTEHARTYGRQGAHLIICSRSTEAHTTEKWIMGGRAAAVMSGAFCLSSNRGGLDARGLGGHGWTIEPDQGKVLGTTSAKHPFLTLEIDLSESEQAKSRYPRYVDE